MRSFSSYIAMPDIVLVPKRPGGLIARVARSLCLSGGLPAPRTRRNVRDGVFAPISRCAPLVSIVMSAGEQCCLGRNIATGWSMLNLWARNEPLVSFADRAKEIYCCALYQRFLSHAPC